MKNFLFSLICLFGLAAALCTACKSSPKKESKDKDVPVEKMAKATQPTVNLLTDSLLPQHIDYNQDISRLSYPELRILRNYVYAIHGYWILEADLNSFFINRTDWYLKLCDSLYWAYETCQTSFYAETLDQVKLTPTEKAFVEKVDRRMEELIAQKYVTRDGCRLLNPSLCINMFQMVQPDSRVTDMLGRYNCAMAPTAYEQLFNVYESNDYHQIPNFITTDLYLQAFHMYFTYVLKSLEKNHFTPALQQTLHALYTECRNLSGNEAIRDEAEYSAAFFAIAYRLLTDKQLAVPAAYEKACKEELQHIAAGEDTPSDFLDHTDVVFPYSLFKPRGHYNRDEASQRYFRAMMWVQSAAFCRESEAALWRTIVMAEALNRIPDEVRKSFLGMHEAPPS